MKAILLEKPNSPLKLADTPLPMRKNEQILIKVTCCGLCRTDLHIIDGELKNPKLPLVLGHQIVGTVSETGSETKRFKIGDRVGVPWLGGSCGKCRFCKSGRENLCDEALYAGFHIDGGFAEFCAADEKFCYLLPSTYNDSELAPFLCAGLIGLRALNKCGDARRIGFYGFGSSAHILIQIARNEEREIFAFTKSGDTDAQEFAMKLGAKWAGDSGMVSSEPLDAAIIFAPVGELVPLALKNLVRGGKVVCAGIHMSDIPSFPYELLWNERTITSVANLTRHDVELFFKRISGVKINSEIHEYSLEDANKAVADLRSGKFNGTAVIRIS